MEDFLQDDIASTIAHFSHYYGWQGPDIGTNANLNINVDATGHGAASAVCNTGAPSDYHHVAHSLRVSHDLTMSDNDAAVTPGTPAGDNEASPALPPQPVPDPPASTVRRSSNGHVPLAQKPRASHVAPRTSRTTVSSPQNAHGPSLAGGGPTAKDYTVPPRPKPGRKPATDEPASKRKAQNRLSQRTFRARKAQQVAELKEQIEDAEQRHRDELASLQEELNDAKAELDYWKREFHLLRENNTAAAIHHEMHSYSGQPVPVPTLSDPRSTAHARHASLHGAFFRSNHAYGTPEPTEPLGCDRCEPHDCKCMTDNANVTTFQDPFLTTMTPLPLLPRNRVSPTTDIERFEYSQPVDGQAFASDEIDFTTQPQHAQQRFPDNDCGWCENDPANYCACKDQPLQPVSEDATAPLSRLSSSTSMEDVKLGPVMPEPGSCVDCQVNPQQRAWCQRVALAQLRSEATPPSSRRSPNIIDFPNVLEPEVMSPFDQNQVSASPTVGQPPVGCSDTFKLFVGRVSMDIEQTDWRSLKPVSPSEPHHGPRDTFTMEPGRYSAMELDASSILTTLQHSGRPLEPRPSDGPLASLVREAAYRRQATMSPMTGPDEHGGLTAGLAFDMGTQ